MKHVKFNHNWSLFKYAEVKMKTFFEGSTETLMVQPGHSFIWKRVDSTFWMFLHLSSKEESNMGLERLKGE